MLKKIESQLLSYNGKEKLTVDEYYNVLKVQVLTYKWWKYQTSILSYSQFKVDCTKNDIRKVVADLPMDKHYKVVIKDFIRVPILSDDVFKAMDKNNDGEVSKVI